MAGLSGKASLAANTKADLYTVPGGCVATLNVSLCNRGAAPVTARVAVRTGASVTDADFIEYDAIIPANGILERTQVVMVAGETLSVQASAATVSARIHGFEEAL